MPIVRVTLMELPSGVKVYDRTWGWPTQCSNADGICSMGLTLFKLSRDSGFEPSSSSVIPTPFLEPLTVAAVFDPLAHIQSHSGAGQHHSLRARKPHSASASASQQQQQVPRLRYVLRRLEHVAMAVFHDASDDTAAVARFVQSAGTKFEESHGATVAGMRARFAACEKAEGAAPMTEDELRPFTAFDSTVDELRSEILPPPVVVAPHPATATAATPSFDAHGSASAPPETTKH